MADSLKNFTKNREVIMFDNILKQTKGLMFHKKDKKIYLFKLKKEKKIRIHGFFVFYKLYLYFFNENEKLIEKTILKPWSIYNPKKKFKYMIESFYELN